MPLLTASRLSLSLSLSYLALSPSLTLLSGTLTLSSHHTRKGRIALDDNTLLAARAAATDISAKYDQGTPTHHFGARLATPGCCGNVGSARVRLLGNTGAPDIGGVVSGMIE